MTASSTNPAERQPLGRLEHEHFAPLVGQAFALHLPEGRTLQLQLAEATRSRHQAQPGMRQPFSLLFRCPELPEGQYILQGSYPVEHPALGRLEYFMTPIQPDAAGMRYECVFA